MVSEIVGPPRSVARGRAGRGAHVRRPTPASQRWLFISQGALAGNWGRQHVADFRGVRCNCTAPSARHSLALDLRTKESGRWAQFFNSLDARSTKGSRGCVKDSLDARGQDPETEIVVRQFSRWLAAPSGRRARPRHWRGGGGGGGGCRADDAAPTPRILAAAVAQSLWDQY